MREYKTPTLESLGSLADLTAGGSGTLMETADNGNNTGMMAGDRFP